MLSFKKLLTILIISFLIGSFLSFMPLTAQAVDISAGDLIKASSDAVYYYGSDGNRYCFPNEKTYKTWYEDFSTVKTITDAELAAITLKGNVTYKPGVKMVKIQTDPNVYAVDEGGTLRWVVSETVATALYDSDWNTKIDDIPVTFFINYKTGSDINSVSDFDKSAAETGAPSIDVNKGLTIAPPEEPEEPSDIPEEPSAPTLEDPGTSVDTGTTFTISWSVPSEADSYTLQRDTDSSFTNPTTIYSGSSNNATNTPSPVAPTSYYYRVKASNSSGASAWSNTVSIDVTVIGAPDAPTLNDLGTSVAGTAYSVSWSTISGAMIYVLERDTNSSFTNPTEIYAGSQTSFSQTLSPASDTTYYYRVQARNNVGHSAWSDTVDIQVTAACPPPDSPILTDPGDSINTNTAFNVTWSTRTGVTSYTLQRDTDSSFTNPTSVYTDGSNSTSESIAVINTYYYRVKATSSCGDSDWSNSVDMVVEVPTYDVPGDYATIQAAIDAAPSGTTINIAAGTYYEHVVLKDGVSLKGTGPSLTIIDGSSDGYPILGLGVTATIEDLTVQNSQEHGIQLHQSCYVTVKNCIMKNNSKGIGFSGGANTVTNSFIINNSWRGVSDGSGSHTIVNNVVYGNRVGVFSSSNNIVVKNNIVTNNTTGIDIPNQASLRYNDVWNNSTNYDGVAAGANDIAVDPKYVNAVGGDYHLQSSSPAIDAGDPSSSYSDEPAPNGSRINMGAYGNTSGATTTPVVQTRLVPSQYFTVQAAIDAANAGDTIQVAAGTYNEKLTLKSNITIQGAGAGSTIFQKSGDAAIEIKNNVDNVTISGFTVQNSGLRGFTSSRGAIDIDDSSNITIFNCEVIDNISINGAGLDLDHSNNVTIKNCVFADNSASNIGSLSFLDAQGIVLENVTVADNSGSWRGIGGIAVYYSVSDITIKNSIIWDNGTNLDISAGTVNVSYTDIGGGRQGTGNINQDPKFVGSGDYHLQSSSPAIDAGNPASSYSNEPSPNGSRINMGAYGNTSGATSGSQFSQSYTGPDTSSDGVELTNFSVTGSNTVGGTLTVQYTYRNTNSYSLNFSPYGVFVGCRNPNNVDFGPAYITLSPGESYNFSASKVIDKTGSWRFWPAYYYNGWGPYEWHQIIVPVN